MKFRTEIIIASSLHEVTKLFADQDNNQYWQSTFVHMQRHNFDASRSLQFFKINGRIIEVNIQVVEDNLPLNYRVYCEMQGLAQKVNHIFSACSQHETKWVMESEFIAESLIVKIFMLLLPSMFKKQSRVFVQDFKNFAENMKIQPNKDKDKDFSNDLGRLI
ncbi:MAG: hypothetical protein COB24_08460 [Hyphomicrobiales bacterium]|nr:MAG: hypothetical protein COB24_08460 [Hyphomicrobiales bacterium]